MTLLDNLKNDTQQLANPNKAKDLQRYFKTGKGQYAEGDIFLGLTVPQSRIIAKKYINLSITHINKLLSSTYHEERLIALLIMVHQFALSDDVKKKKLFNLYLKNTKHINNWDLVDLSAGKIVGAFLFNKDKAILAKLAKSDLLWDRRIAIIATGYFIAHDKFAKTCDIARILLYDKHDLIHKAVGWMLREVGKRDKKALEVFLKKYYKNMPRTMLRYAIEKFPENIRKLYLQGNI
ncbi:DNA alkylation repair protein [Candidatus Woesebacteria bacterium]|nr:MAG: DNA alkylation repair protein [Candidatus Woesebacteria bacterium]